MAMQRPINIKYEKSNLKLLELSYKWPSSPVLCNNAITATRSLTTVIINSNDRPGFIWFRKKHVFI